jgi:hypothetical protein
VRRGFLVCKAVLDLTRASPLAQRGGGAEARWQGCATRQIRDGAGCDECALGPRIAGALRIRGGAIPPGPRHDPERVAQRRALVQALRESARAEEQHAPERNAIDELLRQRAATNLPCVAPPSNGSAGEENEGGEDSWEPGSSFDEEQNVFVRTPRIVDPVYGEEYEDLRETALANGEVPPPRKIYHAAYWTEAVGVLMFLAA